MEECELLSKCRFFAKYSETAELACKGFVTLYCRGPKMNECKRKAYRLLHGAPPPDNMLPSGGMVAGDAAAG